MKRSISYTTAIGAFMAAGLLAAAVIPHGAAAADGLALKRVVLSSGGVGYFEYEAEVDGNAELVLDVPLDQVDDVLKSIVVLDDKGGVGSVSLAGREPLEQVFKDLPFGRDSLSSPAELLNALQGAEVQVAGPSDIEGRVLQAVRETVQLPNGGGTAERHRVSVMTAQGVRQFVLEDAGAIAFKSPELQRQLRRALAAMAAHRVKARRTLTVTATGTGKRLVRAGYVVAAPLWKSSYRLVLPDGKETGAARLQGWAMVDNLSGMDWTGVDLTLLSGNPVTFRQALYMAYFVQRPQVPVEVAGRILPPVDGGTVGDAAAKARDQGAAPARIQTLRRGPAALQDSVAQEDAAQFGGGIAAAPAPAAPSDLARSIAATAEDAATQISFHIAAPVTVANGSSIMIPVVDRDVPATRLSAYQPQTHTRHPVASVRVKNDSQAGLPPGVITLFDRSAANGMQFAGDARLGALPAGDDRLVGFALDQKTLIDRETRSQNRMVRGKIDRGVLTVIFQDSRTTVYRIKAPAEEKRTLVIEHPRTLGWDLAAEQGTGVRMTDSHYRFDLELQPGEERRFEVTLERDRGQRIELSQATDGDLVLYASSGELKRPLRDALKKLSDLRGEVQRHEARLNESVEQERGIAEDQQRIRQNLAPLRDQSDLRRRYIAKLDDQENELERLRAARDLIRKELDKAREDLKTYIAGLNI